MARRVFFSFHYKFDIFRANQVRNSNVVAGPDEAGFFDHSEYEAAKKKGDEEIKRLIRAKLVGTTVTTWRIKRDAHQTLVRSQPSHGESISRPTRGMGTYEGSPKRSRQRGNG